MDNNKVKNFLLNNSVPIPVSYTHLLIKYLEGQKTSGAAFDNTVYESYDAWIETIKKQIKKSENTLKNIEFKKVELEAVQKYIA